ncbi:sterol 26-hydroxylase, mitochondrial-like [Mixophyes fleayi]|uniref:sterol 26-hydroxylase, mitochondrial-like n=1 Tax=Mixophyes fleayi TaxID=3061075 RepID=UPI003F4E00A2
MMITLLRRVSRTLSQPPRRLSALRYKASLGVAGEDIQQDRRLKTIDDLPGPSQLESLYWLFLKGFLFRIHELQVRQKKKFGPMWGATIGHYKMVNIACPEILETLLKQEGKYPMRADMLLWREHRSLRGHLYGPLSEQGDRWLKLRSVLNQKMIKPTDAASYTEALNVIVPDLLNRIKQLRAESPSGLVVHNVASLMYNYAFESICTILFETRLGCLDSQVPEETQKFLKAVSTMMENEIVVEKLPKWASTWLPFKERFLKSWDTIFTYGTKLIDQKLEDIEGRLQRGDDLGGAYLTHLLTGGKLEVKDVYGVMPELLLAGVDTTSNTVTWALYLLSRHPEIQLSLYEEVMKVTPGEKVPTSEDLSKMPLLKAVIKETLRLYPVIPINGRILVDKDVELGGYAFPKDTLFVLCHYVISQDEVHFPEPDRFVPQRWLRSVGITHHPFGSIPFGYGPRGCLGRRVAELEMHLSLAQIIKTFQVVPDPAMGEVRSKYRLTLVSDRPIDLQFIDRQ